MTQKNKINVKQNIKQIVKMFENKTGCAIQHNNSPCNTCFHGIDAGLDWQHITWLILLGIRGDYDSDIIIKNLKKELKINE